MFPESAKQRQTELYPAYRTVDAVALPPEQELTLRDLLQMFRRRRVIMYGAAGVMLGLGILFCVVSTRRYEAAGTIQVQKESSDGLDLDTLTGTGSNTVDALNADINMQTQASILQSDTLALRVIHNLKLEDTPEFHPKANPLMAWVGSFLPQDAPEPAGDLDKSPRRQANVLKIFHKNLTVKPVAGTRLIEVDYLDRDPKLAADVVNELVQALVDYSFETRYKATEAASESLSKQLAELRARSEGLQARVAQMQRDSGIYSIGTTDAQGREQAYSATLDQFQRAATTLSDASQNRILKEAIYQAAKTGDAEMLSSLAGNALGGSSSSGITNSLGTIQALRGQEAALQGQLDQMKTKFGPGYPKISETEANIGGLERAIQQEVSRIGQRARNDYMVANETWKDAKQNYDQQKVKADALNDKAIQYTITRQEADDSRTLYEDLLKRLKEAGILQGLKSSTITVVDQALVPVKPKKPNVPLYLAGALAFGLFLGGAGVLVVDTLDDTVQDASAIEHVGLPLIGVLPRLTGSKRAIEIRSNPKSRYSEMVRNLRSVLTRAKTGVAPKVILITSAVPGEGKTTLSTNLAASFVQQGKRVLLLEADMRRPVIRANMGLPGNGGLSLLLTGQSEENAIFAHPQMPGLFLLPEGAVPAFPSELLESDRMRELLMHLREEFDVIVIDAPPVLPVADARVLSEMSDLTIQLARFGVTTKTAMRRAHDLLTVYSKRPVGIVLNGVPEGSGAYHDYYGYHDFNQFGKGKGKEGTRENA
jgi:succinoglycan biosynthesis transport protein ExoP